MKILLPALYLVLLIAAVPWFWTPDDQQLLLGIPRWVVVAIAVSALVSLLTLFVLSRPWPQESESDDE